MSLGSRVALIALNVLLAIFLTFFGVVLFDPLGRRARALVVNAPAGATLGTPTVTFLDPKRGDARGTIRLIEFGDYECSFCAEMEPTLNAALRGHPNLQLVWKDLPNPRLHKEARPAALAARCAGRQGKFWEYHDLLFENQGALREELYPQLAERVGADVPKFTACMAGREEEAVIDRNVEEAIALGVDGSPFFFLGNARLSGKITPEELAALLNRIDPLP